MASTEAKWDGSAGRFDDAQWRRSCVLDMADCSAAMKNATAKERFKLPIREPGGSVNVNALGAASAALAGARTPLKACPSAKKAAAKKLVAAYGKAKLDAPESIEQMAGVSDSEQNGG